MLKLKAAKLALKITILACIAIALVAIITLLALENYSVVRFVQFSVVPLCLAFTLLSVSENKKDGALVAAALFFTACADFVMVVLDRMFELSIVFFIAGQLCYLARIHLSRMSAKYSTVMLSVRGIVIVLAIIAATFSPSEKPLLMLAAFYFINLLFNAGEAAALAPRSLNDLLFCIGLILFVGCDVCVGLSAGGKMLGFISLTSDRLLALDMLIWIFYTPSQVAIALSAQRRKLYDRACKKALN